jgi:hypothetical protein
MVVGIVRAAVVYRDPPDAKINQHFELSFAV